jgi:hypothetical protein
MFDSDHPFSWYQVRPEALEALLAPRGFGRRTVTGHTQEFLRVSEYRADGSVREVAQGVEIPHFTLVAERGK